MALTETAVRNAKPTNKPIKLFDGGGMFLLVNNNGSKWWRLKYRINGKEKLLSFGVYPEISLKRAREKRDDARKLISNGVDPAVEKLTKTIAQGNTFESIAREWLTMQEKKLATITLKKAKWMLETFAFPQIGSRPITQITAPEILAMLRKVEAIGINETARRTKQRVSQIYRYAIATGRAERDLTVDLRGALAPVVSKNHAAITEPTRVGELLRAIDGYQGHIITHLALKLAPLVFVRPGELRAAQWDEVDLGRAEWRIAAERMKMREQHIVPLSTQAVDVLQQLQILTGNSRLLFPSLTTGARPMSENTINAALRRLGYSNDEMTGHGFRAMASTCLNELGWHPDVIELQLAHAERNKVRAAYNRAQRIPERRKMMQAWADYLDELRIGTKIVPFKRAREMESAI